MCLASSCTANGRNGDLADSQLVQGSDAPQRAGVIVVVVRIELDSRCQPWAGDAPQRAGVIVVVVSIELDSRCQPWAGKVATGRRSIRLA